MATHTHQAAPTGARGQEGQQNEAGTRQAKVPPGPGCRLTQRPARARWPAPHPDPGHQGQPLTLVTFGAPVAGGTLSPTLATDGVTGRAQRTHTRLPAPRPKRARLTLCRGQGEGGLWGSAGPRSSSRTPALTVLAPGAPEARLAGAAAVPPVARPRVLLLTPTLLRAARPEGPRRAGCTHTALSASRLRALAPPRSWVPSAPGLSCVPGTEPALPVPATGVPGKGPPCPFSGETGSHEVQEFALGHPTSQLGGLTEPPCL